MPSDWTRRDTLASLAALGAVACTPASDTADTGLDTETSTDGDTDPNADCADRTGAQVEGPFYPGEPVERMDIRDGQDGVILDLDLLIQAVGDCAPIEGAEVDVWSADVAGAYSGYERFGTEGEDFLRGQQITDSEGLVRFTAIVPGSYPGRAVHLHVKVRAPGREELTTQVYLPNGIVTDVLGDARYAAGAAMTRNEDDNFYAPDTLLEADGTAADGIAAVGALVV